MNNKKSKQVLTWVLASSMLVGSCPAVVFAADDAVLINEAADAVKLEDGNYYVEAALWNEFKDEPSMGDAAFKNNRKVLVTVKDGKVTTVQVATNPVNVGTYVSAITDVIIDGVDVDKLAYEKMKTVPADNEINYLKEFSFEMPDAGQPADLKGKTLFPISFSVPDTPMPDEYMTARLMFSWDTAKLTEDSDLVGDNTPSKGSSSITGEEIKDLNLKDAATGVKLDTTTDALSDKVALAVNKLTAGADYDKAKAAMAGVNKNWELYKAEAMVDGAAVQPSGTVKLSIPSSEKGLEVYRINDSGRKVAIHGAVENGYYVFNTSSLGLFAVVNNGPKVEPPLAEGEFRDVPANHWAKSSIDTVVERKLFSGTSDTTFGTKDPMTRAMFVTVLGRLAKADVEKGAATKFSDVPTSQYYAPYVAWAVENGIVSGTSETTFTPNRPVTRQEMAVFLVRYCKFAGIDLKDGTAPVFKDAASIGSYAKDAVTEVAAAGLLKGNADGTFAPLANATRAEVAAVIARFIDGYNL